MKQCNLNGTKAYQCSFDNSDFFSSRFIKATLVNTSFRNCNLKKTIFNKSDRQNVSFKMSNTREAIFDSPDNIIGSGEIDSLQFGKAIVDGD